MATRAEFPVVVATDGSGPARAAVAAAATFPWPAGTRPRVVLARGGVAAARWPAPLWAAFSRSAARIAGAARRVLARRWPEAELAVVDQPPVQAILAQARSIGARAIVVGSRGQGMLGRLVLGSVSRAVVRRAPCAVLVAKGRPRGLARLVVGVDGSAGSRRAAAFVARLAAPAGGQVIVVRVVEAVRLPSIATLPPAIRARLRAAERGELRRGLAAARREVEAVRRRLARAGWRARGIVVAGVPLPELLRAVTAARAGALVVGARGIGGLERRLLGSVAEGVLARSPVSVLVVKEGGRQ